MSTNATRRWLVYLPQPKVAEAALRYGSDDKVRELLCAGLDDLMRDIASAALDRRYVEQALLLSTGVNEDTMVMVSLRVPIETSDEFDLAFGAYGSKTAAVRFILAALLLESVYEPFQQAIVARRAAITEAFGGNAP